MDVVNNRSQYGRKSGADGSASIEGDDTSGDGGQTGGEADNSGNRREAGDGGNQIMIYKAGGGGNKIDDEEDGSDGFGDGSSKGIEQSSKGVVDADKVKTNGYSMFDKDNHFVLKGDDDISDGFQKTDTPNKDSAVPETAGSLRLIGTQMDDKKRNNSYSRSRSWKCILGKLAENLMYYNRHNRQW